MAQALQPRFDVPDGFAPASRNPSEQRRTERAQVRLAARVQSFSRFTLESLDSDEDHINDVTIRDLSLDGLATEDIEGLRVGAIVRLQIPLVGWRNAEVRWIRGGHAGCRFLVPLAHDELRAAIVSDPLINSAYPGLVPHIDRNNPDPLRFFDPVARSAPVELVRLPTLPASHRAPTWPAPAVLSLSFAIALFAWAILYALVS